MRPVSYTHLYYSERFKGIKKITKSQFKGEVRKGKYDYFEFEFNIGNLSEEEITKILRSFRNNVKYYKLLNGEFIDLEEINIKESLTLIDNLLEEDVYKRQDRGTGRSNPLGNVIFIIFIGAIWQRENIICKIKVTRKNSQAKNLIAYLKKIDNDYSDEILDKRVEETYFKMQEAWTNRDTEISREYMSDSIYDLHTSKLAWMKVRNQRNILNNIKLLDFKPVSIKHYKDNSKDVILSLIHISF